MKIRIFAAGIARAGGTADTRMVSNYYFDNAKRKVDFTPAHGEKSESNSNSIACMRALGRFGVKRRGTKRLKLSCFASQVRTAKRALNSQRKDH